MTPASRFPVRLRQVLPEDTTLARTMAVFLTILFDALI